eukprot:6207017-Pleurochrysis_carterae.AAC.2
MSTVRKELCGTVANARAMGMVAIEPLVSASPPQEPKVSPTRRPMKRVTNNSPMLKPVTPQ